MGDMIIINSLQTVLFDYHSGDREVWFLVKKPAVWGGILPFGEWRYHSENVVTASVEPSCDCGMLHSYCSGVVSAILWRLMDYIQDSAGMGTRCIGSGAQSI